MLALPLKTRNKVPFEQLLGTKETLFRMAAVVAGLIVAAGSLVYLYLTITTAEQDVAAWARVLEIVYAIMGVLTGGCMIGLAKAQGAQMTEKSAAMTLVPLFWSCLHLLVNYRMTCTDPKLASFGFGLVADVMIVLAFYELARLLFGKPAPAMLAFFAAVAVTMSVSDIGGYGLAMLMGIPSKWSIKMVLRGILAAAACVMLAAELFCLCRSDAAQTAAED